MIFAENIQMTESENDRMWEEHENFRKETHARGKNTGYTVTGPEMFKN